MGKTKKKGKKGSFLFCFPAQTHLMLTVWNKEKRKEEKEKERKKERKKEKMKEIMKEKGRQQSALIKNISFFPNCGNGSSYLI